MPIELWPWLAADPDHPLRAVIDVLTQRHNITPDMISKLSISHDAGGPVRVDLQFFISRPHHRR